MKNLFSLLMLLYCITANSQSTTVVISQVYPGGGSGTAGVTYKNDYVELHNVSAVTQDISNFSLQYGSATGNFGSSASQIYGFQANTTIAAGAYLLIQVGTAGAAGVDLPVTPDLISANLNLGAANGKIALVNIATGLGCGATATPCTLPSSSIVDLLSWGTANNAEGGVAVAALSITTGAIRKINGCQDTDNNLTDFDVITNPVPRNSASPVNVCGALGPILSAGPAITNLTTNAGVASAATPYNLSGSNLTGFPGNITVTASANLEVSLTSGSGYAASINVPFTGSTLTSTPVYVRIAAAAPQGAINGTITNSGGGAASPAIVTVTGGVYQNYYNTKANLGLTNTGTWSSTLNGAGLSPADFTSDYQLFNIVNQANTGYSGVWNVTGAGNSSRIVVGDGTAAVSLTVLPGVDSITSATRIDILNNATLVLQNNRRPFLNNIATGSTINFAQTGLTADDTIKIPALSYYNLALNNGIKILYSGTITVRGNMTVNNVNNFNGSPSPFSTLNALGDVTFSGTTAFEPFPSGDNARLTLAMNGTIQNIFTNGNDILLFRLRRDTTSDDGYIEFSGPNTEIAVGNAAGGGLQLNQGISTVTQLNIGTNTLTLSGGAVSTNNSQGKIFVNGGNIGIEKSAGTTNAGTLRFIAGSVINNFNMNFDPAFIRDSVTIADDVSLSGNLSLIKGKIVMASGKKLGLTSAAATTGGSVNSFVDGILSKTGAAAFTYHVGKGTKYAPVESSNESGPATNTYDVQYFNGGYGNYTINPTTLLSFPNYNVSPLEWWKVDRVGSGAVDLTFNYTDVTSLINLPNAIRMAHFGTTDWNDLGGTPGVANTNTNGNVKVTGVNSFSPFTFSATAIGVIPIKLNTFTAQKFNNAVKINWSTSIEINSKAFIVERSVNGTNWTDIATIPAAGNSQSKINYTVTDNNPAKGINFYRLRQTDLDNRVEYSATKSVLFNTAYDVLVSPNPATDMINIYVNNNSKASILLTDASGMVIRKFDSNLSLIKINTATFARGVYYVKVILENNVSVNKVLLQ